MLKVFYERHYISVNDNDWRLLGRTNEVIVDEEVEDQLVFENISFGECRKYIEKHSPLRMYNSQTAILHKPLICFIDSWYLEPIRYKHFEKISYKICYEEKENITMEYVLKHFPAEQGMQYFKERGLSVCPIGNS